MTSIVSGLFSGRAGLSSHGSAIAVVGDNLANSSTIAYKASRAEFEDVLAGSGGNAGAVIGSGSAVNQVTPVLTQGTLEKTGRSLDLAIEGNGYFIVSEDSQQFYTRAGNFKVDTSGFLVNQNGLRVLGFPQGGSGSLEELNINTVSQDSVKTTEVNISGNLDATASITAVGSIPAVTAPNAVTPPTTTYAQLAAASQFSQVMDVYDTLGSKHTVNFFFFHTAANSWTVNAYVNSEEVDATAAAGIPRLIGTDTMAFTSSGSLTPTGDIPSFTNSAITWRNGSSQSSPITFNFPTFTQYSSSSSIFSKTQDGQGVGSVTSFNVQANGDIYAILDNGQSAIIGTVGLASFSNAEALTRAGKNLLQKTAESGEPIVGSPGDGQLGTLSGGALELSNTDIATEFVKLIQLQRGYQANSKIITTINDLLGGLLNLV